MVKLTIDEVEYETDDFTEEQQKMVQEITYNSNVQKTIRLSNVYTKNI